MTRPPASGEEMDIAEYIAVGISLINTGIVIVAMSRLARRNEAARDTYQIDKILFIVTELQKDAAKKTAVDAVQNTRIDRAESDIKGLQGMRT